MTSGPFQIGRSAWIRILIQGPTLLLLVGPISCTTPPQQPAPLHPAVEAQLLKANDLGPPDTQVVHYLQETIGLWEQQLDEAEARMKSGQIETAEVLATFLNLTEARVRLAQELKDQATVIQELQNMIAVQNQIIANIDQLQAEGRTSAFDSRSAVIGLLQLQIRLRKAQLGDMNP